jgi:rhodanese-related sulfurtransferase
LSQSRYDRRWHTIAAQIPTSDLSVLGAADAHFSFLFSAFSFQLCPASLIRTTPEKQFPSNSTPKPMFLRQITDSSLAQNAYLIGCQRTGEAVIIDPKRDLDRYFQVAEENDLRITAVADTHIHADYQSLRATSGIAGHVQILPAHGAGSACGKSLGAVPNSVMGYERKFNAPFREALTAPEDQFVNNILAGQPEPPLYFARMKRDNKLGPALLRDGKLPSPERISADQLGEWIGKSAILDLRSDKAAFADKHLEGALFAPISGGRLPIAAGSYVAENTRILLAIGKESQVDEAVRQLIRIGLDRVEGWILIDEAFAASAFTNSYPRIATRDLPAGVTVLDVRRADEYEASHVRDAKNIAYTRLAARFDDVPPADPLYIHCAGGTRAAIAAAYLANRGRRVVHVDGDFAEIPASMIS